MTSFETMGYQEQEINQVISKEISPFELFQRFMIRTGKWETPEMEAQKN